MAQASRQPGATSPVPQTSSAASLAGLTALTDVPRWKDTPVSATVPEPRDKLAHLDAEIDRLREQVLELGEMLTGYERRLGVHERFQEAAETRAAPLPPYEQAAAWQARRRSMRAVT